MDLYHTEAIIDVVDAIYAKLGGKKISYKVIKRANSWSYGGFIRF